MCITSLQHNPGPINANSVNELQIKIFLNLNLTLCKSPTWNICAQGMVNCKQLITIDYILKRRIKGNSSRDILTSQTLKLEDTEVEAKAAVCPNNFKLELCTSLL